MIPLQEILCSNHDFSSEGSSVESRPRNRPGTSLTTSAEEYEEKKTSYVLP
jgi:hypothetical protein